MRPTTLALLAVLFLPRPADASRAPERLPEPAPSEPIPRCDPALSTEGRWILRNDDFGWRGHTLVHDENRDRLIVFGGTDLFNRGPGVPGRESDRTWIRPADLSAPWESLATSGTRPPRRIFHVAIYDPVNDRMLVHGGRSAPTTNKSDLWQLDFRVDPPHWSQLQPAGLIPDRRSSHTAIYDPGRRRMLIFGGLTGQGGPWANDFWELPLDAPAAWRKVFVSGGAPSRREGMVGTYDSRRERWIFSGGNSGGTTVPANNFFRDVHVVDLATMQRTSLPDMPHGSYSLFEHTMTYDAPRDRLLVFGGAENFAEGVFVLELSAPVPAWRRLAGASEAPETRVEHTAWFDARRNHLLVLGGGHTGDALPGTHILSFGHRVRATLDPDEPGPFVPQSHRPRTVILHGADDFAVADLEPTSIRVGGAAPLPRGRDHLAFSIADADGDGDDDALVEIDGFDLATASLQPPIEVGAFTKLGEDVCGTLELDPVGTAAEDIARSGTGAAGPRLTALPGGVDRHAIRLRVDAIGTGPRALELWSVRGARVASGRIDGPGEHEITLRPARALAPGVYWARVAGEPGVRPLRLVIPR